MDTKIFEEIGFSQGEIKVYFTLLELGESTIGPIAKKSQVTSAKTYPILEKLKRKGLVTSIIKRGTNYFQVLNPNRIFDYLDEKEKKIKKEKSEIKKILPFLKSKKVQERQYATVYETFEGIKSLYDEMLEHHKKSGEDFISFTLGEEYKSEQANLFFKQYDVKRRELKIKMRLIGLEKQKEFLEKEYGDNPNIELRYVKQSIPTGVIIYGENVVTLLWTDIPTAFVIHSKQNASVYRKFFEDLWKKAKK